MRADLIGDIYRSFKRKLGPVSLLESSQGDAMSDKRFGQGAVLPTFLQDLNRLAYDRVGLIKILFRNEHLGPRLTEQCCPHFILDTKRQPLSFQQIFVRLLKTRQIDED